MKTEQTKPPRKGSGGARLGAGRHKLTGEGLTSRYQVSLDDAAEAFMRELGLGSLSEGIRKAAALLQSER